MVLALVVCAAVVALGVIGLVAFAVRRRVIQRAGGTFDCSYRLKMPADASTQPDLDENGKPTSAPVPQTDGKGWVFGIGRYSGDSIEWFRVFSYAPRPRKVLPRREIEVLGRRYPEGQEELALLSGSVVLRCLHNGAPLELAMSEDALTGFLAWLEAAPPGQRVNVA
ncbi:DUF2550 domain-containing protein [Kitasatospora sp. CM 4170]|uniref:DUF2550 domain-containing protein n=1 Tax=Kitasatospora TaxID=2063 RepID=UPI001EECD8EA|nr:MULTISPECIES: DUF2550 domain-containing protein [unclassified Kitasatospora]MCG6498626.1 DUF2550 domain-containing protein [Kitasatospora sp. A2-31]WNM47712.1 DUF2550 domain-containing protein [Kitasatospora sp. CM 4170]